MSSTAPESPAKDRKLAWPRRWFGAVAVLILIVILPAILLSHWVGPAAALAFPFGFLGGILGAHKASQVTAWRALPILVIGGTLACLTSGTWSWAAVLAALGVVIGVASTAGRIATAMLVGIIVVASPSYRDAHDVMMYAGFLTLGYVVGVIASRFTSAPAYTDPQPFTDLSPVRAGLLCGAVLGLSGALSVVLTEQGGWTKSSWLPLMFLILLEFYVSDPQAGFMIVSRLLGTVAGIAVLVPLLIQLPVPLQLVAFVALIAAGLATSSQHYWLATAFIAAGVVIASSIGGDPTSVGSQRILATFIAFLLLGLIAWGMRWVRVGQKPAAR
jgi:hypothetical protein